MGPLKFEILMQFYSFNCGQQRSISLQLNNQSFRDGVQYGVEYCVCVADFLAQKLDPSWYLFRALVHLAVAGDGDLCSGTSLGILSHGGFLSSKQVHIETDRYQPIDSVNLHQPSLWSSLCNSILHTSTYVEKYTNRPTFPLPTYFFVSSLFTTC